MGNFADFLGWLVPVLLVGLVCLFVYVVSEIIKTRSTDKEDWLFLLGIAGAFALVFWLGFFVDFGPTTNGLKSQGTQLAKYVIKEMGDDVSFIKSCNEDAEKAYESFEDDPTIIPERPYIVFSVSKGFKEELTEKHLEYQPDYDETFAHAKDANTRREEIRTVVFLVSSVYRSVIYKEKWSTNTTDGRLERLDAYFYDLETHRFVRKAYEVATAFESIKTKSYSQSFLIGVSNKDTKKMLDNVLVHVNG